MMIMLVLVIMMILTCNTTSQHGQCFSQYSYYMWSGPLFVMRLFENELSMLTINKPVKSLVRMIVFHKHFHVIAHN